MNIAILSITCIVCYCVLRCMHDVREIKRAQEIILQRIEEMYPRPYVSEVNDPSIYDVIGSQAALLAVYNEIYSSDIDTIKDLANQDRDRLMKVYGKVQHHTVALALVGIASEIKQALYGPLSEGAKQLLEQERGKFDERMS